MTTTIQINGRGTLTLPKELRKRLGLEKGGVVMADESQDGIVLKPAVAFPVEMYSDERIEEFDTGDEELRVYVQKKSSTS